MERASLSRLRWRMRGAWLWPAFAGLTVVDGVVLHELPIAGERIRLVGGVLIAAFANLLAVAVLGPLVGRLVRRRRRDMPKVVAENYAGSFLVGAIAVLLVAGGLVHRPAVVESHRDTRAEALAAHDYVFTQAPAVYRANFLRADTLELQADLFRTCVPGARADRPLCLYIDTSQSPPGVRLDPSREPNTSYAAPG